MKIVTEHDIILRPLYRMKCVIYHAITLTEETQCHFSKSRPLNEIVYENQLIYVIWHTL
jgi:hypothetical protein